MIVGAIVLFFNNLDSFVQAQCSDVHVVFARGMGEKPGLGICGEPLVRGITSNLPGMSVSSYAVIYSASTEQASTGLGAKDMTNHVISVAQSCPDTVFVLGGFSQGAGVTDISIGIWPSPGTTIPKALAPRIKAIVTFGNPLLRTGQTIKSSSSIYGSKAIDFCSTGDPVCSNGTNMKAHGAYPTDGSVTSAAQQAAALLQGNKVPNHYRSTSAPGTQRKQKKTVEDVSYTSRHVLNLSGVLELEYVVSSVNISGSRAGFLCCSGSFWFGVGVVVSL
ncbi:hypothetical protein PsorP6_007389 [Peronosclerospora sorghi]|uniref:Uncharacterized protein n=1 Tax=Peronosclerospora sorghi TaxID=230839 RepID=A0ACC0WAR5_9STRA|nr:hypothetical protein PsorP6_007389 [Peronosclerospora sorghi]